MAKHKMEQKPQTYVLILLLSTFPSSLSSSQSPELVRQVSDCLERLLEADTAFWADEEGLDSYHTEVLSQLYHQRSVTNLFLLIIYGDHIVL
jgi:hypothetical protein